jgi:predicted protein tyrosine phosphatase
MLIEPINLNLGVCAMADLPGIAKRDPDFWNLISIRGVGIGHIGTKGFRQVHKVVCEDIRDPKPDDEEVLGYPQKEHVEGCLKFARTVAGEPILIHCVAGVSRSTAIALILIIQAMKLDGFTEEEIVEKAPGFLVEIRPQASPNPILLEFGIKCLFPKSDTLEMARMLLAHPALPNEENET